MIEFLKAVLFGIVQGITEWLPISSTGHMILLDEFVKLNISDAFYEMFQVVIQFGSILAVIVLFFNKLNPLDPRKSPKRKEKTWRLWFLVVVAVVPSAVVGLLLDDWMDAHLYNYVVVALMLILYGVAFLFVEDRNARKKPAIASTDRLDLRTALLMGAFQCLALIPRHLPVRLHHFGRHSPGGLPGHGGGILLLYGHSHHAGSQRPENGQIFPGRRKGHGHRDHGADRGLYRGFLGELGGY